MALNVSLGVNAIWAELGGWKQVSRSCGDLPMDECFIVFSLMFIFLSFFRGEKHTVIHLDLYILDFSPPPSELPIHVSYDIRNGDSFLAIISSIPTWSDTFTIAEVLSKTDAMFSISPASRGPGTA